MRVDSRILIAASADISDETTYLGYLKNITTRFMPQNLASKFNLTFSIMDAEKEIPEWFTTLLAQSVSEARVDPMTPTIKTIYSRLFRNDTDYVVTNGNMREILRIKELKLEYDPFIQKDGGADNAQALINFTSCDNNFLKEEIAAWAESIDASNIGGATVLNMLYWEVYMGNLGALIRQKWRSQLNKSAHLTAGCSWKHA